MNLNDAEVRHIITLIQDNLNSGEYYGVKSHWTNRGKRILAKADKLFDELYVHRMNTIYRDISNK